MIKYLPSPDENLDISPVPGLRLPAGPAAEKYVKVLTKGWTFQNRTIIILGKNFSLRERKAVRSVPDKGMKKRCAYESFVLRRGPSRRAQGRHRGETPDPHPGGACAGGTAHVHACGRPLQAHRGGRRPGHGGAEDCRARRPGCPHPRQRLRQGDRCGAPSPSRRRQGHGRGHRKRRSGHLWLRPDPPPRRLCLPLHPGDRGHRPGGGPHRYGRCRLPHPREDPERPGQGGHHHHQRGGVRALHHLRPPADAGAPR